MIPSFGLPLCLWAIGYEDLMSLEMPVFHRSMEFEIP